MSLIRPVESSNTSLAPSRSVGGAMGEMGLGKDAFMKLLLAELRNQDPLKPMEDKDFIAQLAQFNALEELQVISQTLGDLLSLEELAQGSALIGRTASGLTAEGESWTGTVTAVAMRQGWAFLVVDGQEVPLSWVTSVA